MPVYRYRCQDAGCRHEGEVRQGYAEAPWTVCPACGGAAWQRVFWERDGAPRMLRSPLRSYSPHAPSLRPEGRPARFPYPHGHGAGRPFATPYVTHERDGSETVYTSEGEAFRGELDRTGDPHLARRNLGHIRRLGYVEGTRSAAFKEAIKPLPKGDVPR